MIGTQRRRTVLSSQHSVNGRPQPRNGSSSNNRSSANRSLYNTDQSIFEREEANNFDIVGTSTASDCKQQKNIQKINGIKDSLSSDSKETEELFNSMRHGTPRPFSNEESSDKVNRSLNSNKIQQIKQNDVDSDSSSEDSVIITPRTFNRLKRPLILVSTSDSSDSDEPISFRRSVKRMRLPSSSESSSSEMSSDISEFGQAISPSSHQIHRTTRVSSAISRSARPSGHVQDDGENVSETAGERLDIQNLRGRRVSDEDIGNENNLELNSHILRRHNAIEIDHHSGPSASRYNFRRTSFSIHENSRVHLAPRIGPQSHYPLGGRRNPVVRIPVRNVQTRHSFGEDENSITAVSYDHNVEENEEDSGPVTRSRTVRGRRTPVIESEDETGSQPERGDNSERISFEENRNNGQRFVVVRVRRFPITVESENNVEPVPGNHNVLQVNQEHQNEDDSGPVLRGRTIIGRRLPVVVSEEETGSITGGYINTERIPIVRMESHPPNLRERRSPEVASEDGSDIIPTRNNIRRRNAPLVMTEDDSSNSDSEIRPRPLSDRRSAVLRSDRSSTDSDDSIRIGISRRRNRRSTPIPEYDLGVFEANIKASTVIKAFANAAVLNGNSSDSDGELEKCPICLAGFKLQEIGKPTSCEHKFCSLCIKEWATKNNTCPVDRKVFNGIVVYAHFEGKVICELPVEKPNLQDTEIDILWEGDVSSSDESWLDDGSDEDGPEEICCVCYRSNRTHQMISCDSCNYVYHLNCVDPPLQGFPPNDWYCPSCVDLI